MKKMMNSFRFAAEYFISQNRTPKALIYQKGRLRHFRFFFVLLSEVCGFDQLEYR